MWAMMQKLRVNWPAMWKREYRASAHSGQHVGINSGVSGMSEVSGLSRSIISTESTLSRDFVDVVDLVETMDSLSPLTPLNPLTPLLQFRLAYSSLIHNFPPWP